MYLPGPWPSPFLLNLGSPCKNGLTPSFAGLLESEDVMYWLANGRVLRNFSKHSTRTRCRGCQGKG